MDYVLKTNPSLILARYSVFPVGQIRHNDCDFYLLEEAINNDSKSCKPCFNARYNIRETRLPEIFAAIEDAKCRIRPDKDQIENELKLTFGNRGLDTESFEADENVEWMCKMMRFSGHSLTLLVLDDGTKTTLLFCKQVSGNKNCRGFWMTNNYSTSKSDKIRLCWDCQIYERNAHKRQERREVDKGGLRAAWNTLANAIISLSRFSTRVDLPWFTGKCLNGQALSSSASPSASTKAR